MKKAAGGVKTTTATASHNATDFIAACARPASARASFNLKPDAGIGRQKYRAVEGCDTVIPGARHTMEYAGNLPDSEVFSRPEFKDGLNFQGIYGFGAGSAYPQGRQHGVFHVSIPSPTRQPRQPDGGFQSQYGAEAMTTVNTTPTPKTGNTSPLTRQQAIENALSGALHHARNGDIHTATGRAIRAASMLKQACSELATAGRAA
ncbi:hypothetical protein [Polaromonas naphthalenivorans]|nr:hypothetical protein [Polaromonas naphthalenivorans]